MNIVTIIIFSLSIISLIIAIALDFTKIGKYATNFRCAHYSLVFLTALFGLIHSISGVKVRVIIFSIITLAALLIYEGINIFNLYSSRFTRFKNKIELYSNLSLYLILFIVMTVYYGFNFVELIIQSVLACLFYLTIYIIKRNETVKSIRMFFLLDILISLSTGLALTGLILSNRGSDVKMVFLFLTIGMILMYLSSAIRDANNIFEYVPNKKYFEIDKSTYFIFNLGISFIAFSILFIYY